MNSDAFKSRLKEIIGEQSVNSFAKKCGITEGTLRRYLNEGKLPGHRVLKALADGAEVNSAWLGFGQGPKKKDILIEQRPGLKESPAIYTLPDRNKEENPFVQSVGYLKEIFDSQDEIFISAIMANLHSFSRAINREKEIKQLTNKIDKLEENITNLRDTIKGYWRPREDGPERREYLLRLGDEENKLQANGTKIKETG